MNTFTKPETFTELDATLAGQLGAATHASLDKAAAPMLGAWVKDWRDDFYCTEYAKGIRPVGWVIVNTRKRGPVLAWCDGWTKGQRGYLASIAWPKADYMSMTDGQLQAAREEAIEEQAHIDELTAKGMSREARKMGYTNQIGALADITTEQRRRMMAAIIKAGSSN